MRLAYDAQVFNFQVFGGISRYFCALAQEVSRVPEVEARIIAPLHINRLLKAQASHLVTGRYVPDLPRTWKARKTLNRLAQPLLMARFAPDIVHETYFSPRPPHRGPAPTVLTVYDMIHERFPESFAPGDRTAANKAAAVARADHIFCISESTRRDLLEHLRCPEERVSVVYLGCDRLPAPTVAAQDLVGPRPYLLYVGARDSYKNFDGLLRAYAASRLLQSELRLVCLGGGPLTAREQALMAELGLDAGAVTQLGGGDERLAALYRGAVAFVYPSLYEGFGIPPLEAMSVGCPVICSNTSSIPEVVGEAGEYFDPHSVASIRAALERVVGSDARRAALVDLGQRRQSHFSWARCAAETLATYRTLTG